MQSERLSSERLRDSARFVARELLREPVREAVHDALHEEAAIVRAGEGASATEGAESERPTVEASESEAEGGRSRMFWAGVLLSLVGLAYVARRRMESSWSGARAGPEGAGYATEGQLETDEPAAPPGNHDRSPTTEG